MARSRLGPGWVDWRRDVAGDRGDGGNAEGAALGKRMRVVHLGGNRAFAAGATATWNLDRSGH